jgi:hypothetical protein
VLYQLDDNPLSDNPHLAHFWGRDDRPVINVSWHSIGPPACRRRTRAQPSYVAGVMRNGIGDVIIRCVVPERVGIRSLGLPSMGTEKLVQSAPQSPAPRARGLLVRLGNDNRDVELDATVFLPLEALILLALEGLQQALCNGLYVNPRVHVIELAAALADN